MSGLARGARQPRVARGACRPRLALGARRPRVAPATARELPLLEVTGPERVIPHVGPGQRPATNLAAGDRRRGVGGWNVIGSAWLRSTESNSNRLRAPYTPDAHSFVRVVVRAAAALWVSRVLHATLGAVFGDANDSGDPVRVHGASNASPHPSTSGNGTAARHLENACRVRSSASAPNRALRRLTSMVKKGSPVR